MRSHRFWVREAALCALVLGLSAYSWMYSSISVPNERSRAYLTMAIVDDGSIVVDAQVRRFGPVFDLATFGGHYFTDKAPGSSLLAVPHYAVLRRLQPTAAADVVEVIDLVRTWLMLPIGLLGFVLLRSLLRALRVSEPALDVASLGFSVGSSMLHYSGAFYGHAIVAVLALGCLRCLVAAGCGVASGSDRENDAGHRVGDVGSGHGRDGSDGGADSAGAGRARSGWAVVAAGACAGMAGLSEYQAIPLALLLGLPIVFGRSRLRDLALYSLGGVPFAGVLLLYNWRAFGSPFALSYQHLLAASLQELHGSGLAGATRPTWDAFVGLLFSQHRGLCPTAPLLGIGLGALIVRPRALPRALWLTLCAAVAYFLLIVASSSVWYGGWSFGPRLLVPIMGLLALPAASVLDASARAPLQFAARSAAIVGVLYQNAVHAVFPELPPEFTRPLPDALLPLWHARMVAPNLACKWSALAPANLIPLALLVGCSVSLIAFRGLAGRPVLSAASLCGGCALFLLLLAAPPSIDSKAQDAWLRHVRGWQAAEQRCRD